MRLEAKESICRGNGQQNTGLAMEIDETGNCRISASGEQAKEMFPSPEFPGGRNEAGEKHE